MTSIHTTPGSAEVIVMDRFRSGKGLSPIRQAEAYWMALRDGFDVPKRSLIDPRGLENILEYAFVLERIAPGIARFRLAGQHLASLAGMEVRGMPLTSFFSPASRAQISATLEHVFDSPAVAELTLASERRTRHLQTEARMILLPLRSDLGDVSRALGVLVADGPPARTPCRFDVTGTETRAISGLHAAVAAPRQREPGFAEPHTPLTGRAPYLRLIKSDD